MKPLRPHEALRAQLRLMSAGRFEFALKKTGFKSSHCLAAEMCSFSERTLDCQQWLKESPLHFRGNTVHVSPLHLFAHSQ